MSKDQHLRISLHIVIISVLLISSLFISRSNCFANNATNNPIPAQQIMITEVMINPQSVPDKFGEWFELFNYGTTQVNINGWMIYDFGGNFHIINNGGPLYINPNSFLILARSNVQAINGGLNPDYVYGNIKFDDETDELIIATGFGMEIDRIEYSTANGWPVSNGESIIFTGMPVQNNNTAILWQQSSIRENGYTISGIDKGSPGTNGSGQNMFTSTTWIGSGYWNTGNANGNFNWTNGSPGHLTEVIVAGTLQINSFTECDRIIIEPYSSLTINPSGYLNIVEDLIINSDDQNLVSGSFIDFENYSVGGFSSFKRHIPDGGWHFLSSPVEEGSGFLTADLMPDTGSAYMIVFNDGYLWGDYIESTEMTFEVMKGYSVWLTESKTIEISGIFNTGETEYSPVNVGNKFNLIGNPYPSTIDWSMSSGWTRNRISPNIWIWNQSTGNYGVFLNSGPGSLYTNNATQYIPACQGFFVQTTGSNPILKINNYARTAYTQPFFKNNFINPNLLRVSVTGLNGSDEMIIRFLDGATNGFDQEIDIEKLMGGETAPQLYTYYKDSILSIATFPSLHSNKIIPIAFEPRQTGNYSLILNGKSSLSENIKLVLEDKFRSSFTEVSENFKYKFSSDSIDKSNRFNLHFLIDSSQSTTEDEPEIFSTEGYIYLRSFEPLSGNVDIYNLLGQSVISTAINSSINKINMQGKSGCYIISYTSHNYAFSKKVIVN